MRQTLSFRRAIVRTAVALAIVASVTGVIAVESHPAAASKPVAAAVTQEQAIVNAAALQAGVPYCEGGGGINGPSVGNASSTCTSGVKGYDCMSLAQYAVYQATGITVPGPPADLPGSYTFVPPDGEDTSAIQPGDVVFFGGSSLDNYSHSGIYAGNNEIWDALAPGDVVEEHTFATLYSDYGNVYRGAVQYWSNSSTALTITTSSLPAGTEGTAYSATLAATGGNAPYSWTVVAKSGRLPPGLKLNHETGTISGTPTRAVTHSLTIKVKDTKTKGDPTTSATSTFSIAVNA
jgi:cell wall-associated NlpC family hydrolase